MSTLSITLQLILSLSILVTLHEFGHYLPAKWFKTRVEKFYLFFNPYFSLYKKKIGETEWGIGWIPFGGYVKISGMIDESMDKDQMKQPVQPWEFRAKKAWQRLIIMTGGVIVNFILAFIIFAGMLMYWGTTFISNDSVIEAGHGIRVYEMGEKLGLQNGDNIIAIDDIKFDKFDPGIIAQEIVLNDPKNIKVLRNGQELSLPIPANMAEVLTKRENKGKQIFNIQVPVEIAEIVPESPAAKAGLQKGDRLLTVNGQDAKYFGDFINLLQDKQNQTIDIVYTRDNIQNTANVVLGEDAKLGFANINPNSFLKINRQKYGITEAIPKGIDTGVSFLTSQFKAFAKMGKGEIKAKDSLGSVISIATMFDSSWQWERFWRITGMLSMLLGFFNLLPIPGLDGGYVMFLLWEIITGKKVSDKTMEIATTIGFVLLMGLMIFSLGNDIRNLF